MKRLSARQAFQTLALLYRKINSLGVAHQKTLGLANSLMAIAQLDIPGEAGAVLTGMEAQGTRGWSAEMAAHLRRLGISPRPLEEAATVWHGVALAADVYAEGDPRYRTIASTYRKGLSVIMRRIEEEYAEDQARARRGERPGAPM